MDTVSTISSLSFLSLPFENLQIECRARTLLESIIVHTTYAYNSRVSIAMHSTRSNLIWLLLSRSTYCRVCTSVCVLFYELESSVPCPFLLSSTA